MNFQRRSVGGRRGLFKPNTSNILIESYPHELQFYKDPPTFEISFKEFEECTAERLTALQIIDEVNSRGLKGDEWRRTVCDELKKQPDTRTFCKLITGTGGGSPEADFSMRRRDHISHFVLRLAYCNTEEKRRWFISRELDLFRLRWPYLKSSAKLDFLKINDFKFNLVSEEEKRKLLDKAKGLVMPGMDYYKVGFIEVSELIRTRKVFLQSGYAFITSDDIISVLLTMFRTNLAQSLAYASRRVQTLNEDERVVMVLKAASQMKRETFYRVDLKKESIDIRQIDSLADSSFPPCMLMIHKRLRADHHLRHSARQQYGLFIKGIGVTLEDSLSFWRSEFTKKIDLDKFEKQYAYNIRHNYGKEGKRANYAPQSCMKIIATNVGPGEQHGCPFKCCLSSLPLSSSNGQDVLDLAKAGHYQQACGRFFALKHAGAQATITHPNHYFDLSQGIHKGHPGPQPGPSKSEEWGNDSGYDFNSIPTPK